MPDHERLPAAEAMRLHYARSRLPADGGRAARQWTVVRLGPFALRLSNFQWRQRALPYHDLHHLLTGYPCTPAGELQIAAWRGRRSKTLYRTPAAENPFALSVRDLRARLLPRTAPAATMGDLVRYLGLAASSLALMAIPILILWTLFLNHG